MLIMLLVSSVKSGPFRASNLSFHITAGWTSTIAPITRVEGTEEIDIFWVRKKKQKQNERMTNRKNTERKEGDKNKKSEKK